MSEEAVYRVVRGGIRPRRTEDSPVVAGRRGLIGQGEIIPPGVLDAADIRSLVESGRIERADVTMEVAQEAQRIRAANPFRADPASLVGKTMEDLTIMVLEIDDEYDVDSLKSEADAVRLLTSGWEPNMRQTVAPVTDRSRPQALALHKLVQEDGGHATRSASSEMSADAQASLEAAKARAQAPETEE